VHKGVLLDKFYFKKKQHFNEDRQRVFLALPDGLFQIKILLNLTAEFSLQVSKQPIVEASNLSDGDDLTTVSSNLLSDKQ
jgi:hypothetical protein